MAALIVPGTPGRIVVVHQRKVERAPYTNCGPVDNARQAIRAGLAFPSMSNWIAAFRQATTVPEVADGKVQGTTNADRMRAWAALAPWYPIVYGPWDPDTLWDAIEQGEIDASCSVTYGLLPTEQRRWSPSFTRGHQIGAVKARRKAGVREVMIVDGLGTGSYSGDWMSWSRLIAAMPNATSRGKVYVQTMQPGAGGMSIAIEPKKALREGTTVKIPKGTRVWTFDPAAHNLVASKAGVATALSPLTDATVSVTNLPKGRTPTGSFERIISGGHAGKYVRSSETTLIVPPATTDCKAQVDAATLPLRQEIAAQDKAIDAAMTALKGV